MINGLLLTLISGLFFLIGIIILNKCDNKESISLFTIALAFIIMLGLVVFDLLPELIATRNIYLVIPAIGGLLLLYFLDKLIPHHNHHHKNKCNNHAEHEKHLNHIGIITIIALALHNMIEGIALYNVTINSAKSGLLMMISVGCHNIPLGFQIGNVLSNDKKSKLLVLVLIFSAVIGALLMISFGTISELIINIILAISLGMIIYIMLFELFKEVCYHLRKREVLCGIIVGIIVILLTSLI